MPTRIHAGLVCFSIALCLPTPASAQALATQSHSQRLDAHAALPEATKRLDGRLFFSARERQRLDDVRRRGLSLGATGEPANAPPSVLNGFVKRSDGSAAVWVDGNVLWNAQGKNAASLVPSDVGGPAAYLKVVSEDTVLSNVASKARAKNVVKPRARKIAKPSLLPK